MISWFVFPASSRFIGILVLRVGTFALNQVLRRQPDLGHGIQVSLLLVIGFTVGFGVSNLIQLLKGHLVGV
jgi:predicted tellurium resistance membrane protein TerC